ncbi:MAG: hypothetical protein RR505_12260 [Raoultibacter sp.]
MKKAIIIFLTLALLVCSSNAMAAKPSISIQSLAEQAQVGWHQSYNTVRGETINVDIAISVPEITAFPCYYAVDMPAIEGISLTKSDVSESGEAALSNKSGFFRYDWPNHTTRRAWQSAAEKNGTALSINGEPRALMLRFGQFDMDIAYAVNNPATMASAWELMNKCAQEYFPDQQVALTPHWIHAHVDPGKYKKNKTSGNYDQVSECPDFQGCLFTYFDQLIGGIPVLGYGYQGYADYEGASRKDENKGALGGTCITQGLKEVGSEELYRSLQFRLITPSQILAEDVPFCDLDAVLQTAGQLIEAGQLRTIDSLRLGYVVWLDKKHTYQLMPTWVMEGELFEDAKKSYKVPMTILSDEPVEYANIYINAQTGELINPWTSAKNRAYDAPELLRSFE